MFSIASKVKLSSEAFPTERKVWSALNKTISNNEMQQNSGEKYSKLGCLMLTH